MRRLILSTSIALLVAVTAACGSTVQTDPLAGTQVAGGQVVPLVAASERPCPVACPTQPAPCPTSADRPATAAVPVVLAPGDRPRHADSSGRP